MTRSDQCRDRSGQIGHQPDPFAQLEVVDQEFDINQPAPRQLGIKRTFGGLVPRYFGPHRQNVLLELGRVPGLAQHPGDDPGQLGLRGRRAEQRPGAGQRHMLPGPGLLVLIAGKAAEAHRQRALCARRPEPRIHLIERALGSRDG